MRIPSYVATVISVVLLLLAPTSSIAQSTTETVYLPLITVSGIDGEVSPNAHLTKPSQEDPSPRSIGSDRLVTVMTRNLYFGADLEPVITAATFPEFLAAVATIYQSVIDTNFPERSAAIADEIAATQPVLIGLQEVALWRTGPLGDPEPATVVAYDFLQLLLDQLAARGLHYEAVAVAQGFDAEVPNPLGFDVRLTIHDVVLARADLMTSELKVSNAQAGSYAATLTFTLPDPVGEFTIARSWAAVDAKIRGKQFRFITTHLEPFALAIRQAQALEILSGPANTTLPVILVGDINAEPGELSDAADILITSGFTDVWGTPHPGVSGYTCCQAADLRNDDSLLDERIDLVLVRGGITAIEATVVGDSPEDKTPSGLWPSDHAGVIGTVKLPLCSVPEIADC